MSKKVLLVGLKASVVDFRKWPDLSVQKLEAAFNAAVSELSESGYTAQWCLTDTGETAEERLAQSLETFDPDIVLIGAGVRTDADHLPLFEKMVNLIHEKSPGAKMAFNTSPFDTVDAVKRWA